MQKPRLHDEWHKKNKMPKNPKLEERLKWHREHAKQCACRPIPTKLLRDIRLHQKFTRRGG